MRCYQCDKIKKPHRFTGPDKTICDDCANPRMAYTLDEYFEQTESRKLLVENLRSNLEAMTELTSTAIDEITRLNLIMIRQHLEHIRIFGDK